MKGSDHTFLSLITGKSVFFYGFKEEVIDKLYKYLVVVGVLGVIFQAFAPKVAVYFVVAIYLLLMGSLIIWVRMSQTAQAKSLKPEYTIRQVSWVLYYMLGICCFMFVVVVREIVNAI